MRVLKINLVPSVSAVLLEGNHRDYNIIFVAFCNNLMFLYVHAILYAHVYVHSLGVTCEYHLIVMDKTLVHQSRVIVFSLAKLIAYYWRNIQRISIR